MFNAYIEKAMRHAEYERTEDGTYFGRIPGFKGVWANTPTEQECREELRDVLEGWVLLNIADHTPLPIINGITLEVREQAKNGQSSSSLCYKQICVSKKWVKTNQRA